MRTGPTGVILSTLNEGRETAKVVVKDLNEGNVPDIGMANKGFPAIASLLKSRGINPVSFAQWERIDKCEQKFGASRGKPREKIVDVEKLLSLAEQID